MARIALIGAGAFAQTHLKIYEKMTGAELLWVCDANLDAATAAAERYGIPHVSTDYREALADPDVEVVDIVTPNFLHLEVAVAAASAGKHIICEKPLALTAAEGERMAGAARENGVALYPKYHQRFDPVHQRLAEIVGAGGGVFRVGMARRLSNHLGTLLDRNHWRGNPALTGGGLLFSSGSHTLDVLAMVFGPVTAVTAVNRQLVADDPDKADDNATVVLEHASGGMSTFTGCWTVRQESFTVVEAYSTDDTYRVVTDGDDLVLLHVTVDGTEELERTADWFYDSNRRALELFVHCVDGQAEPIYTIEDILTSMRVLEAAYRSSDEQRRVTLG